MIVWIDDSVAHDLSSFVTIMTKRFFKSSEPSFEIKLFDNEDEAIEFTLKNSERVFLFIQDASRPPGSIVSDWQRLRPAPSPSLGMWSGSFYTYVIDAFVPEAGAVFAGFGYSKDEIRFVQEWGKRDKRIVFADKMGFVARLQVDKPGNLAHIAKEQMNRWSESKAKKGLSRDTNILKPLAEEMSALCSINPSTLRDLSPREFEELVASLFKNNGFTIELTARTRDGGYDIVMAEHSSLDSGPILVECKHFAPGRPVGVGIVRALYGVKVLRSASKAILATSSYVSKDAKREFSRVIPWELDFMEYQQIIELCRSSIPKILDQRLTK